MSLNTVTNNPVNTVNIATSFDFSKIRWDYRKNFLPKHNIRNAKSGENDLATTHPALMEEWDYEANNLIGLNPQKLSHGSNKRAFWRCKACGYKWNTIIANRTKGSGCPICKKKNGGLRGTKETLAVAYPNLIEEWDYRKNDALNVFPDKVTVGSGKYVNWKCSKCSNEWVAKIYDRTRGCGCPICNRSKKSKIDNEKNIEKANSLAKMHPELLKEWNYSKNEPLGLYPERISRGSHTKVWWKCSECSNEWETEVRSRTCMNSGCPNCTPKGRKPLK